MQKILVATRNLGKFNGLMEGLKGLPYDFLSLRDIGLEGDAEETGSTYEENAVLKAEFFGHRANLITIADDSGIVVEAIRDELGVKTRRWGAGEKVSDSEWLDFFLKRMEKEPNRRARFICVVALFRPGHGTITFRGETDGAILAKSATEIEHGIPLSSVFLPEDHSKVYSAMSKEEFVRSSHRGKAVRLCGDFLSKLNS